MTRIAATAAFAAALALADTRASGSSADFLAPFLSYPTGRGPVGLAAGDLDGDGRLDLVAAASGERRVSTQYAQANGSFARGPDIDAGDGPVAVALGDVDGDGRMDLVAAAFYDNLVSISRQQPDGGFERLPNLDSTAPIGVALVDLNGDTALDVVSLESPFHAPPGGIAMWPSDGAGGFGSRRPIAPNGWPVGFEVAQADSDAFPDLVVLTEHPEGLEVLRNNGNGTFAPATSMAIDGVPVALATGDWNGDSRTDVAVFVERFVLGSFVHRIIVATGRTDGGLDLQPELLAFAYAADVASRDVNADGKLDLVSCGIGANVYLGRGDGTFGFPRPFETGNEARQLLLDDFDQDGTVDVAAAASASDALCVLPGHGDGTFGHASLFTVAQPQAVALGDWNGDTHLDVALPTPSNDVVAVHLGRGDGSFGTQTTFAVGAEPAAIASGDLNNDGALDLACVTFPDGAAGVLSVLLGDGHGSFAAPEDTALPAPATALVLGDWNADDALDVAVTCWSADWPDDGALVVLLGVGDGSFAGPVAYGVGPLPMGVATADLNADGFLDLVATFRQASDDRQGGTTRWLGDGQGGFVSRHDQLTGREPRDAVLVDLDADGAPDLVLAHSHFGVAEPGSVAVLRNRGDGVFEPVTERTAGGETYGLVLADFDRDGRLDVAAANAASFTVTVWRGLANATLGERIDLGTGPGASQLVAGDLDGDARPDLVTANRLASSATVLLCRIASTPVAGFDLTARRGATGIELEWRLAPATAAQALGVHVERAVQSAQGPWERRTLVPLPAALHGAWTDAPSDPERPAWYRLAVLEPETTLWLGPIAVEPQAAAGTGLVLERPVVPVDGGPVVLRYRWGPGTSGARLDILDVRGRIVRALDAGPPGTHVVAWDRRDGRGRSVARGAYWVRLAAGSQTRSARLLLVRP